jgi:DnaJ-domain-containing protein 1
MFERMLNILKANLNTGFDDSFGGSSGSSTIDDINKEYERLFGSGSSGSSDADFESEFQNFAPKQDPLEKEYYAILELPYGSSFEQIKLAYKRLIKEYHPDKFQNDKQKHDVALEVAKRLNMAYNYFEKKFGK